MRLRRQATSIVFDCIVRNTGRVLKSGGIYVVNEQGAMRLYPGNAPHVVTFGSSPSSSDDDDDDAHEDLRYRRNPRRGYPLRRLLLLFLFFDDASSLRKQASTRRHASSTSASPISLATRSKSWALDFSFGASRKPIKCFDVCPVSSRSATARIMLCMTSQQGPQERRRRYSIGRFRTPFARSTYQVVST